MTDHFLPRATPGPAVVGAPDWLDEFVRSSDCRREGREGELRALLRSGELVRTIRGVARWADRRADALARGGHPRDDEFLARIRAAQIIAPPEAVASHASAALLWGMSTLSDWPTRAVQTLPLGRDSRVGNDVVRHGAALERVGVIDGLSVTTPARTIADVARTCPRTTAFELVATGLFVPRSGRPLATTSEVRRELELAGSGRGIRSARALLDTVGVGCESAAEARSLMLILDEGFERPEQQVEVTDVHGRMIVDCMWRAAGIVGECDGLTKYLRADRGDGQGAAQAVIEEKRREDRLRALGWRVVRWSTATLREPRAFAALLDGAGVPRLHRRSR